MNVATCQLAGLFTAAAIMLSLGEDGDDGAKFLGSLAVACTAGWIVYRALAAVLSVRPII